MNIIIIANIIGLYKPRSLRHFRENEKMKTL